MGTAEEIKLQQNSVLYDLLPWSLGSRGINADAAVLNFLRADLMAADQVCNALAICLHSLLQHGTDSYIMITWYVRQARLFSFQPT